MQINNIMTQYQTCEFGALSYGDVFEYEDMVLMKIRPVTVTRWDGDIVYGVVDLQTGYPHTNLADDCLVYVLQSHMSCKKLLL